MSAFLIVVYYFSIEAYEKFGKGEDFENMVKPKLSEKGATDFTEPISITEKIPIQNALYFTAPDDALDELKTFEEMGYDELGFGEFAEYVKVLIEKD
ncbi:uncharacterized protein ASPGLDRAFT_51088 [Aspergillus glaucus CBS 516.65]|uniref:Uncharacterized protein n=1 Tax=Aspergillus glaucus CBS 516.65 TaxID=1160497 RepID=A0A1L9V9W5_ASPGL|nr:hypothetical protein ASPGLDRAFT_51088 [Aspergillus glaucus CBS 516.65]OJJ80683.1 hypothetical protein ASPGLDRAFT_51088 [Aspergillus glaucus CBS 516.65]